MGNIFVNRTHNFRGPTRGVKSTRSVISKLSEYYVVDTLNLCQEMSGPMQKESAQSDHPARRKRSKCGPQHNFLTTLKFHFF